MSYEKWLKDKFNLTDEEISEVIQYEKEKQEKILQREKEAKEYLDSINKLTNK